MQSLKIPLFGRLFFIIVSIEGAIASTSMPYQMTNILVIGNEMVSKEFVYTGHVNNNDS